MSGKLPDARDKGRCGRCCLSYVNKQFPGGRMCFRYGNYCNRVAWNCETPSHNGFRRVDIKPATLECLDKLAEPENEG